MGKEYTAKTKLEEYQSLPCSESFLQAIEERSWEVPSDWFVAVTDVVNSTVAIENGKYKEVNVAGSMTIMALGRVFSSLNFPFVFGGDGMSALVPPTYATQIRTVLARAARDIQAWFDLRLRAALFPLSLLESDSPLCLSKVRISDTYLQAVFHGTALSRAEDLLKTSACQGAAAAEEYRIAPAVDTTPGDYEGFTCRWQDIPTHKTHTVALVVSFRSTGGGYGTTREIERVLSASAGGFHPLQASKMVPGGSGSIRRLTPTISAGGRRRSLRYASALLYEFVVITTIRICIKFNIPIKTSMYRVNKIREQNLGSSDFRKYDGGLKMIVSASDEDLSNLKSILEAGFEAGELFYGLHTSHAAHMTCIANLPSGEDIHFIDATDGGYTVAASAMKRQMRDTLGSPSL